MEGVIGKRAGAAYRSGRSSDWIKLKCGQGDEFIIAGFTAGQGARAAAGDLGALVLAAPTPDGALRWAGNVGSGFDARTLALLKQKPGAAHHASSPLGRPARQGARPPSPGCGPNWWRRSRTPASRRRAATCATRCSRACAKTNPWPNCVPMPFQDQINPWRTPDQREQL
jgi:ATP-dependent DNA ligase